MALERARVALAGVRRAGILDIARHDVGFIGTHGQPGSAGTREMTADEMIGLLAP
ncbi:hypothetical protein [Amycolatopsis sp. NPDC003861]